MSLGCRSAELNDRGRVRLAGGRRRPERAACGEEGVGEKQRGAQKPRDGQERMLGRECRAGAGHPDADEHDVGHGADGHDGGDMLAQRSLGEWTLYVVTGDTEGPPIATVAPAGGAGSSVPVEDLSAREPAILLGSDPGANPAEYLLHALAACLTTSIVYVAAARNVQLTSVESTLTGDIDVRGALGVDDEPRNGFERIGIAFRVTGDAPQEKLREVVERARERSAVYDMVTNGVPVAIEVTTY